MNLTINTKEKKDCHTMQLINFCFTKILFHSPNLL